MICYQVPKKLMISAGEASGELYGAMLSREAKKIWPDIEIFGIGGTRMKEEGVSLIAPISHIMGILEVIKHLGEIFNTFNKAKSTLLNNRPDILVLIDYPDFNIALARKAKEAGIPILYYVSPQVWAWRRGRVNKIASLANKIAVLFPFEVDCYKETGLPCEFVGHPITERINIDRTKEEIKKGLELDPGRDVVTLLPGSRPGEIERHQGIIRELAEMIHEEFPDTQIVVPLLEGTTLAIDLPDHTVIVYNRTLEAVACSEASAVTSGTATLETALLGIPMTVFYKTSFFTYHVGMSLVSIKHAALANLLAGKEIVPEFLQNDATPGNIFGALKRILTDIPYRNNMISELEKIGETMKGRNPSARVASIVGEIAEWEINNAVSV
jgi:lipid-A-disaccharide synthase